MIIFRYIGYALCASSVLILFYEIIKYVETNVISLMTLKQALQSRFEGNAVSGNQFSGFLGDVVRTVVNMPLIAVVIVTGIILIYLTRYSDVEDIE